MQILFWQHTTGEFTRKLITVNINYSIVSSLISQPLSKLYKVNNFSNILGAYLACSANSANISFFNKNDIESNIKNYNHAYLYDARFYTYKDTPYYVGDTSSFINTKLSEDQILYNNSRFIITIQTDSNKINFQYANINQNNQLKTPDYINCFIE